MTLPSMTMQVRNHIGLNLTDQLNVTGFEIEWEVAPRIGKLHLSFRNMEAGRQIEIAATRLPNGVYPDNSLTVEVQLSENSWVLYHKVALISIQTIYDARVDTTWTFERATPRELRKKRPVQKLDWKNLGF